MKTLLALIGRQIWLFIKRRFITPQRMRDGMTGLLDDEVKHIVIMPHGMVFCSNRYGHQVPKYQGPLEGKRAVHIEALRRRFPRATFLDQRENPEDVGKWLERRFDTRTF